MSRIVCMAFALLTACASETAGVAGLPDGALNADGTIDAGTYISCGEEDNVEGGDEPVLACSTADGADWEDLDGDGFAPCECDCDDDDAGVNPDIIEDSFSDQIDQDCDNFEFITE